MKSLQFTLVLLVVIVSSLQVLLVRARARPVEEDKDIKPIYWRTQAVKEAHEEHLAHVEHNEILPEKPSVLELLNHEEDYKHSDVSDSEQQHKKEHYEEKHHEKKHHEEEHHEEDHHVSSKLSHSETLEKLKEVVSSLKLLKPSVVDVTLHHIDDNGNYIVSQEDEHYSYDYGKDADGTDEKHHSPVHVEIFLADHDENENDHRSEDPHHEEHHEKEHHEEEHHGEEPHKEEVHEQEHHGEDHHVLSELSHSETLEKLKEVVSSLKLLKPSVVDVTLHHIDDNGNYIVSQEDEHYSYDYGKDADGTDGKHHSPVHVEIFLADHDENENEHHSEDPHHEEHHEKEHHGEEVHEKQHHREEHHKEEHHKNEHHEIEHHEKEHHDEDHHENEHHEEKHHENEYHEEEHHKKEHDDNEKKHYKEEHHEKEHHEKEHHVEHSVEKHLEEHKEDEQHEKHHVVEEHHSDVHSENSHEKEHHEDDEHHSHNYWHEHRDHHHYHDDNEDPEKHLPIEETDPNATFDVLYNPDNPARCTVSRTEILHPGETAILPGECGRIRCLDRVGNVSIVRCPEQLATLPANCQLADAILPKALYPICCERSLVCS